jgi:hypothetical protein
MRRALALLVIPAALLAGRAALAAGTPPTANGGLSITPSVFEHAAQAGALGAVTVTNRSAAALKVTVAPRPWAESADGAVSADRHAALSLVHAAPASFTLAPGAAQAVNLTLAGAPPGGALYGALEVIGLPPDADKRPGVVVGYRLIGTLRLKPAQPSLTLSAGQVRRAKRVAMLPVTNTGNVLDPVTGSASVKGARGTFNTTIASTTILPGKKVDLTLASGLKPGSYSAKVTLKRGKVKVLTLTRRFSIG